VIEQYIDAADYINDDDKDSYKRQVNQIKWERQQAYVPPSLYVPNQTALLEDRREVKAVKDHVDIKIEED
jgi:hypothetical protein